PAIPVNPGINPSQNFNYLSPNNPNLFPAPGKEITPGISIPSNTLPQAPIKPEKNNSSPQN
ncbi:MAG: biopolymer transporter ExbD, partial [Dolichospermum sp.]